VSENKNTAEGVLEQLGERKSDFWWNLVYFVILAVAIGFVLVNNDLDSIFSPAGVPVFPLKALIPLTGVLLLLQGFAEVVRCIICIRDGMWPQRLHDVEELESAILHEKEFQRQQAEQEQLGGKGV